MKGFVEIGLLLRLLIKKLNHLYSVATALGPALLVQTVGGTMATVTTVTNSTNLLNLATTSFTSFSSGGYAQIISTQAYKDTFRRNLIQT
jgi:hypothetical protein